MVPSSWRPLIASLRLSQGVGDQVGARCGTIAPAPNHVKVGLHVPRSRNTRIRPKDTSRVQARRRYREETRAADTEIDGDEEVVAVASTAGAEEATKRPGFALPNVVEDVKALPQVFRKPLVWLPFGLLVLTFVLAVALINGMLDGLPTAVRDIIVLYISLTLHPTTLFIFFIGGFVAPRASYLVGGMLGLLSGIFFMAVVAISNEAASNADLETLLSSPDGVAPAVSAELALQTIGLGVVIGIFAGGFAAWYRRFLRSSQERARTNRMQRGAGAGAQGQGAGTR